MVHVDRLPRLTLLLQARGRVTAAEDDPDLYEAARACRRAVSR
jgi:hypothetical protein